MKKCILQLITTAVILAAILQMKSGNAQPDDIGTNFFLKASKSVPRIGRRSMDLDNYFIKAAKSVPRIGRRDEFPSLEKRVLSEKYYGENVQPVWGMIDRNGKIYSRIMQSEEPYREIEQYPDEFWQQMKKNSEKTNEE